jgi:hypothetical protein
MTTTIKKYDLELLLQSISDDGAADPAAEGQGLPAELAFPKMVDIALQHPDLLDTVITRHGDAADDDDVQTVKVMLALAESRLGTNKDATRMLKSWVASLAVRKVTSRFVITKAQGNSR